MHYDTILEYILHIIYLILRIPISDWIMRYCHYSHPYMVTWPFISLSCPYSMLIALWCQNGTIARWTHQVADSCSYKCTKDDKCASPIMELLWCHDRSNCTYALLDRFVKNLILSNLRKKQSVLVQLLSFLQSNFKSLFGK